MRQGDAPQSLDLRCPAPDQEARDAALKTGMQDGMSESFDRLAEYLATMA